MLGRVLFFGNLGFKLRLAVGMSQDLLQASEVNGQVMVIKEILRDYFTGVCGLQCGALQYSDPLHVWRRQ